MTRYGADHYGQNPDGSFVYYGLSYPVGPTSLPTPPPVPVTPIISVDPFTATSLDYSTILLNWTQPASTAWLDMRLLSNRYGFPVDENDGTILLDSNGPRWPGSSFLDTQIIPGTYHHYGIYMLIGPGAARTHPVPTGPAPPPNLVSNFSNTFVNGAGQNQVTVTGTGTASITPNVPHGAPYPYGIKYVAPGGGLTNYFTFPFNNPIQIQPSTTYTVSCWVYSPTDQIWLGLNFQNANDASVSQSYNLITVNVNTWTLVSTQITSPAGSGTPFASVYVTGSHSTVFPPYTMHVTGLTVQQGVTTGATVPTPQVPQASNIWIRAGFAACLAPNNYNTTTFLLDTIPTYYKQITDVELTTQANLNPTLEAFLSIIAWSIDYLKTALYVTQNVNNPDVIPINDVFELAKTVGFPQETEISAGVVRRAIKNVGNLVKQRGTPEGIVAYITNLAGFAIDLQAGYNIMLDDLQSDFSYPGGLADGRRRSMLDANTPTSLWNSTQVYQLGDIANYGSYKYISIVPNNQGNIPSGDTTNTSSWQALYYTNVQNAGGHTTGYITNLLTGWPSTYEPRYGTNISQADVGALTEILGVLDPMNAGKYQHNGLLLSNNSGTTTLIDLRSISRLPSDVTAGSSQPDPSQVVGDGIPVPYTTINNVWSATDFAYETGDIVTYQGLPFIALKESFGVAPPTNYVPTNEWQPIGYDGRIQLMTSMFSSGNLGVNSQQYVVQPYVSFFDQYGYPVAQLFPRTQGGDQQFDASVVATNNQAFNHTSASVLTASAVGVTTIDGVTINSVNQNVLLVGQSSANDNGYYDVVQVGTASLPTILQRYNNNGALMPGSYAYVQGGAVNAGLTFYCTNTGTVLLGTTPITFSQTPPNQSFYPGSLLFDSFAKPSDWGSNLTAHQPEVGGTAPSNYTWAAYSNNFQVNAFASGTIVPTSLNAQNLVAVNYGTTNAMLGIDIVTQPTSAGFVMGIAGRIASATSYIRVDQNNIVKNSGGTLTVLATHSVTAFPGDRLTAIFNGNTITAYINGTQVSTATSSFNNTATVFGPIYEGATVLAGTLQPVPTKVPARRLRTLTRARVQNLNASFNIGWPKHYGAWQPWNTVATPRRKVARAFINFKPVTTVNQGGSGHTQPRATLANQRSLVQRHRGILGPLSLAGDNLGTTTNLQPGTVQPDSTVMLPRRRSTRSYVKFTPVSTFNKRLTTVQPRATLTNQRTLAQRHRAVLGNNGFTVDGIQAPSAHLPGIQIQRYGSVSQRPVTQRHRSISSHSAFQTRGPSGVLQPPKMIAQRSVQQRERGSVGSKGLSGAGQGVTTNRYFGTVQPRSTVSTPRRATSRARVKTYTVDAGEPGIMYTGVSPTMQPLAARPVQRVLSQRSRARVKGNINWEYATQTRGPSGTVQTLATTPSQRNARQRSRAVFTVRHGQTTNYASGFAQPRATLVVRGRAANQRSRAFVPPFKQPFTYQPGHEQAEPTVTSVGGTVIRDRSRRRRGKSGPR